MNFEESYQKYLMLTQSNGTTDKLSTSKSEFAVKYNIAQNKVIEWFIENNSSDENRYLQSIKELYVDMVFLKKEDFYTEFKIPDNYFDFIDLRITATNGKCKNELLRSREVKLENVSNFIIDPFLNPSFKYRETFFTIAENSIQVYRKNFEIEKSKITYYRYPVQIELENPDNPESNFKEGTLDFDDKLLNRIIFLTASLHELSADDPKYQAFKQETIQKY